MTVRVVVPLGDYDRYWEPNAIPTSRTPRFLSSGTADASPGVPRDDRPAIAAASSEVGGSLGLADEDTASYVHMDNPAFFAATDTGFGGFFLGVISSASEAAVLPPASGVVGFAYVYLDVIHRAPSGVGPYPISAGTYLGSNGGANDNYYFGDDASMSVGWKRDLFLQNTFYISPGFPDPSWEELRARLADTQVHAHVRTGSNVVYEVAYVAMVIDYEPAVPVPVSDLYLAPRRVFPRDDGLGGGAPRVYPPSKASQSSNRIGGGYL